MYNNTEEFIGIFNEYYPFERYILREPKKINYLFDDAYVTELFIPSTETSINTDEIYVKIKGPAGEMRFALTDFSDAISEDISGYVISDFGESEYQDLYCEGDEGEDYESLKESLEEQRKLITEKYGECNIKKGFCIRDTIELLKEK